MKTFQDFGITDIKGNGSERKASCPRCSASRKKKKNLCLSVNVDKGVWNCHHCEWGGSLVKGQERISTPYLNAEKAYTKPILVYQTPQQQTIEWFKSRGISEAVVLRNKITREEKWMSAVEDWVPVLSFPFFRNGEIVNVKYRDKDKNFQGYTGAERIFYGLDDIEDITYIVEGEMDKLAMEEAGYPNCLSVPDGAPKKKQQDYQSKFDFIKNSQEQLQKVKSFVIAVDNDEAGKILEDELATRLGRDKCLKVLSWPEGCKDANDVLIKHGIAGLQESLHSLIEFPIDGVTEIDSVRESVLDFLLYGEVKGIHPGWDYMAANYTIKPGYMTFITGIPSHGKSEWLDALVINIVRKEGWKFAFYSPENYPLRSHILRLVEKLKMKSHVGGKYGKLNSEECNEALSKLNEHLFFLGSDERSLSLTEILNKSEELLYQKGLNGLVIDPWNEVEHNRGANFSETEYVSKCLSDVRHFVRRTGMHVWIVAHPAKPPRSVDGSKKQAVPTPYDVSGSAHWYNKADNFICVWRDLTLRNSPTHIYTQKIKIKHTGKIGRVLMDYDFETGCYRECLDQNSVPKEG